MVRKYCQLLTASLFTMVLALPGLGDEVPEIPPGTSIKVRIIDQLNSEESETGDIFHGTLDEPIRANGKELYPRGADVSGRVSDVHHSGRVSEPGEVDLVLTTVSSGRGALSISVQPLVIKGESHTKNNAGKIGGGAVLGAIIGGIAGGGKGAAIGAGVGGAAGAGAAAATGKRAAVVQPETVLTFTSTSASTQTVENVPQQAPAQPSDQDSAQTSSQTANQTGAAPESETSIPLFTLRDRRVIRDCVSQNVSAFPVGATERPELPPGSDRGVRRGETLPVELQNKVYALPLACAERLPKLPNDLDRVIYSGRVLLLDSENRILDLFYLDENE
jgi:outer membrane lipoprotein SlyB